VAPLSKLTDPQEFVIEVRRTLHRLVAATMLLFVVLTVVAFFSWHSADQNRQAVCNLRGDLQQRIEASENFVTKHPDTIAKLGFTVQQVQKEILNQRRTLTALAGVSC
jgi:hypothetical protein